MPLNVLISSDDEISDEEIQTTYKHNLFYKIALDFKRSKTRTKRKKATKEKRVM